jgi:GNAT superfamily N-acetyltransferase
MSDFRIRSAAEEDLPQLAALYGAFLDESLASTTHVQRNPELVVDLALARLMRREPSAMFAAEAEGTLAGFAFVEFRPATTRRPGFLRRLADTLTRRRAFLPVLVPARGWLGHLYVAPGHRRKGIAEALVRAAADWAKSEGAESLELNVLAANEPARRFYQKLGMTTTLVEYRLPL